MPLGLGTIVALAVMVGIGQTSTLDWSSAAKYEVTTQPSLVYAEHDGSRLVGDLYLPKGRTKAPALVAIHGGAWRVGNRAFYKYWGPFLARNGYALFTIEYRLGKPGTYPAAVYDVKAAIQFVRARAAEFDIDPDRIGLMGDSAGGQLAALLALAGGCFTSAYRDDPYAATDINVKAVVGFYGIYEMLAQWNHDTLAQRRQELLAQRNQDLIRRPGGNITEEFLSVSPMQNRRIYAESSPISYATADRNHVRFLLFHGTSDELVDPPSQSGAFLAALTRAGFFARLIMIPGAGHYWAPEPFEGAPRSYGAMAAPRLLRFLRSSL
jgi:acetyl esterase/lipase